MLDREHSYDEEFPWYATLPPPIVIVARAVSVLIVKAMPAVAACAAALTVRAGHVIEMIDRAEHQAFLDDLSADEALVDEAVRGA